MFLMATEHTHSNLLILEYTIVVMRTGYVMCVKILVLMEMNLNFISTVTSVMKTFVAVATQETDTIFINTIWSFTRGLKVEKQDLLSIARNVADSF